MPTKTSAPHQDIQHPPQVAETISRFKIETSIANSSHTELGETTPWFKTEIFSVNPSHTELDQADSGMTIDNPSTPTSSVEIITDQPQKSWLSQATASRTEPFQKSWLSQAADADPGWDNASVDLSIPVWMRPVPVSTVPNMPVRANLALLPPYKFPVTKKKQDAAAVSFNRQLAEIQKEASPKAKQGQNPPHLQPPPPILASSKAQESIQVPILPLVKNTKEKDDLRVQKESQPETASPSPQQTKAKLPPHLRTPDSGHRVDADEKTPTEDEAKLPPHLRTPASRVTPSPKIAMDETDKFYAESRTGKIAAVRDNPVPLYSNDIVNQKSHHKKGEVTTKPTVDIDEEVAAGLSAIDRFDNDAAIAATLQAESFYDETPSARPSYVATSPQPEVKFFLDQSPPSAAQHLGNGTGSGAKARQDYTPPHLRASTAAPRTQMLQEVTNSRHNSHVNDTSRRGNDGNGRMSSVKAGKRPARNADFLTIETGTTDWTGNMAPPPIDDDWDDRKKYDAKGNVSDIEFWRQGPTGAKLDTKDPDFQTGMGHASGEPKIMSPIDQAQHITVPNDDDFSQAKRDQNATAAVEKYNAQRLADGKPPYSENTEKKSPTAEEKRAANRARAAELEAEKNRPIPPSEFAPAANIYLRPAEAQDMRQCTEIFNYYATETTVVPELKPITEAYWSTRFKESLDEYKPFVVAVHMGRKRYTNIKDVRRKKKEDIVGFVVAADYGAQGTCYRHSVEVDIFVHPLHLRQGIGGTLLDRLLSALDPGYNLIERAPFLGDYKMHDWVGGGHCICKTVLINILHETDDTTSVDWKMKWLSNARMNFVHTGNLPRIGFKKSKE